MDFALSLFSLSHPVFYFVGAAAAAAAAACCVLLFTGVRCVCTSEALFLILWKSRNKNSQTKAGIINKKGKNGNET